MPRLPPGIVALFALAVASPGCQYAARRPSILASVSDHTVFHHSGRDAKGEINLHDGDDDVTKSAIDSQNPQPRISLGGPQNVAYPVRRTSRPNGILSGPQRNKDAAVRRVNYESPTDSPTLGVPSAALDALPPEELVALPPVTDWPSALNGAPLDATVNRPPRWSRMRDNWRSDIRSGWQRTVEDHRRFYSVEGVTVLAVGFGVGATVAHSDLDDRFHDWYQQDSRSHKSDDYSAWAKQVGEGPLVVACAICGWVAGEALFDRPVGGVLEEWGDRSIHSLTLGAPPLLLLQFATGAPRPDEGLDSSWRPFDDVNGVSGHSFMGALPFINAAKMSDNLALKTGLYACSFAPGWSRMNDHAHYPSQVLLGWWLAYHTASVVDRTIDDAEVQWSLVPVAIGDASGMGLDYRF